MRQLARTDSPDKEQTFVEYLFWDLIMARAKRTLRKAIFQATYSATTPFNWNKILNGWEKLIADAVSANEITVTTVSGETASNVIGKVEAVFDTLDPAVKTAEDLVIALKSSVYDLWVRADRATLGRSNNFNSEATMTLDGRRNAKIIEEPDFTTTKVAIYRTSNPHLSTTNSEGGTWEFQRQDRLTKMMLNGKVGLQFQSINPTVNGSRKNNIAIGQ
jgi:hypothetical protein